jgi:hypothetical protein
VGTSVSCGPLTTLLTHTETLIALVELTSGYLDVKPLLLLLLLAAAAAACIMSSSRVVALLPSAAPLPPSL